jgi:molecular chaperone HtpG
MLQHDRQLKVIANNLEKKIKNELVKLLQNEREQYEKFWEAFGISIKYSIMNAYGANREQLQDLLLFWSSKEKKLVSLKEYRERMPESQSYLYYAVADSVEKAESLPQAERILAAGYEVLYLTGQEDEFVIQVLNEIDGKAFLSVADENALPITEAEKAEIEQAEEAHKALLDFVKETLGDKVTGVRISKILKSGTVCLRSDGPISIEMEQYFKKMKSPFPMQAGRVLELNANAPAFSALRRAFEEDQAKAALYAEILYDQALLISNLPLPDPVRYGELVCQLMQ